MDFYTDYNTPFTPPRTPTDRDFIGDFSPPTTPSDTEVDWDVPGTPTRTEVGSLPVPQTPGHLGQVAPTGPVFTGALTRQLTDNPVLQNLTLGGQSLPIFTYRNPMSHQSYHVVKQPPQKYSCGSGVALMKLLDSGLADAVVNDAKFWNKYATTQLASGIYLRDWLRKSGLSTAQLHHWIRKPQTCSFSEPDQLNFVGTGGEMLERLRQQIQQSGQPAIVGIEHSLIDGHWIIIDSISDTQVILRDPFAGMAHRVQKEVLAQMIFDEDSNVVQETIHF